MPLFQTWIKIDHPNYIYTVVFPTKKEGKNFLQSYPISRIDFLLEMEQKWKFAIEEGLIGALPLNRPPVLAERYARIIWW